ncbi:MAG TPA: DUF1552 domain-containing protein [Polyangia bacterium]|nr:DUF1552 domain-containing protein [Polyangia bacterium]
MSNGDLFRYIPRRSILAGIGTTAAGTLLRPMFASAAGASPTRLLIIHRPCGTFPPAFFPTGAAATGFTLPSILSPFQPLINDMVILNGIYCPRDHGWPGDQHGAGLITMMSGRRPIEIPGTSSGGDANAKNQMASGPSIDQFLLQKPEANLKASGLPSIESTAYRPSSIGLPNFKVMSYDTNARFPESRADTVFGNVFGSAMPGLSAADIARLRTQNKSVLDFVNKDLTRLRGLVPKSQLDKLDAHLDGISALQARLAQTSMPPAGPACAGPQLGALPDPTGDVTQDEIQHKPLAQNQLNIILSAFQCDLTRVATFTFAHGNSALRFQKLLPNFPDPAGHHDLSHEMAATSLHAAVDQFYSQLLADMLMKMKSTPDGDGTLLDHTVVVYFNECCYGWSHSIENMPVLMFGGKSLKLQTGKYLQFPIRYMNDVWVSIANAMGVNMTTFGDTAWSKGALPLFG